MGTKIDPEEIALPFRTEIRGRIDALTAAGLRPPKLVGLLANADPFAKKYADWTARSCTTDGIQYELRETTDLDLPSKLASVNADPTIDGVIVYYPVFGDRPSFFGGGMDAYLRDMISYRKDVEGLSHFYRWSLFHNVRLLRESPFLMQAEAEEGRRLRAVGEGGSASGGPASTVAAVAGKGGAAGSAEELLGEVEEIRADFTVRLPKEGKCILPCTPLACVKTLEHLGVRREIVHGKERQFFYEKMQVERRSFGREMKRKFL